VDVKGTVFTPKEPVISMGMKHIKFCKTLPSEIPCESKSPPATDSFQKPMRIPWILPRRTTAENRDLVPSVRQLISEGVYLVTHPDLTSTRKIQRCQRNPHTVSTLLSAEAGLLRSGAFARLSRPRTASPSNNHAKPSETAAVKIKPTLSPIATWETPEKPARLRIHSMKYHAVG
jgi:hypothetical protein